VFWLGLMVAIAFATLMTVGFRRRSQPLRDAADVLPWVESLLEPSGRAERRTR
jgi:hypothetical protein